MTLSNKHNLHACWENLALYSQKDRERELKDFAEVDVFSATDLLRPPRELQLAQQHHDKINTDVSNQIDLLIGTAIHAHLAKCAPQGALTEKRYSMSFGTSEGRSVKLTGKIDVFYQGILTDFKSGKVARYSKGVPFENEAQLNIYRYLMHHHGIEVDELEVSVWYKDWSVAIHEAKTAKRQNYPEAPIERLRVPAWSIPDTHDYIEQRFAKHIAAKTQLPLCSDEERWLRDQKWKVKKEGRVNAVRVFETKDDAEKFLEAPINPAGRPYAKSEKNKFYIEYEQGAYVKCMHFCSAASVCEQNNNNPIKAFLE
ncbi:MAG: hypothetical protein CMG35_11285 [Candidatus Marinimicrobia bacterium]|nr:hypothetical protein [Candidatus Neomarinimicrobiota bacterium]|tara:strand:+ start:4050 stop:4988 length:939 start_codon:yes stop_codon:yes gene_type:complete